MAELTEAEIITKINLIDTQINTILTALGTSSGAQFTDYSMGNISVSGNQQLEGLIKAREMYQKMLDTTPKTITRDHGYNVEAGTGKLNFDEVGDE